MTVQILCSDVDQITLGTKMISHMNSLGEVIKIDESMRDCDGSYGLGFVVKWENGNVSFITTSDINLFYKENFVFVR